MRRMLFRLHHRSYIIIMILCLNDELPSARFEVCLIEATPLCIETTLFVYAKELLNPSQFSTATVSV